MIEALARWLDGNPKEKSRASNTQDNNGTLPALSGSLKIEAPPKYYISPRSEMTTQKLAEAVRGLAGATQNMITSNKQGPEISVRARISGENNNSQKRVAKKISNTNTTKSTRVFPRPIRNVTTLNSGKYRELGASLENLQNMVSKLSNSKKSVTSNSLNRDNGQKVNDFASKFCGQKPNKKINIFLSSVKNVSKNNKRKTVRPLKIFVSPMKLKAQTKKTKSQKSIKKRKSKYPINLKRNLKKIPKMKPIE